MCALSPVTALMQARPTGTTLDLTAAFHQRAIGTSTHLEVDDDQEDDHCGQQIGDVGEVGAVEGRLEGLELVAARDQHLEQGDERTLKLGTLWACRKRQAGSAEVAL